MNRIEVVRITRRLKHVWADVVNKECQALLVIEFDILANAYNINHVTAKRGQGKRIDNYILENEKEFIQSVKEVVEQSKQYKDACKKYGIL